MSEFQTLLAVVVLIFVLSVIVQALQEVIKKIDDTKFDTIKQIIDDYMGTHLTFAQVKSALDARGLDVTALENFNQEDFRHLLNGIQLTDPQIQGLVVSANATADEAKDHIAAMYDAARAKFQKLYTSKNKIFAVVISAVVVLVLNANLVKMYEQLAADQVISQAIAGTAATLSKAEDQSRQADGSQGQPAGKTEPANTKAAQPCSAGTGLADCYVNERNNIQKQLKEYPILVRWGKWCNDYEPIKDLKAFFTNVYTFLGLVIMTILVSLGAPFWNDVLKGMMGANNMLNSKKAP